MSSEPAQCSTCGATDIDPVIIQCIDCDGEKYYYQLQRWREAAMVGQRVAQELARPRWWERLLKRRPALPSELDEAIRRALELEKEHECK